MIRDELFQALEGPALGARLGVVSTPRRFDRAVAQESNCQRLLSALAAPDDRRILADRVEQLLTREVRPGYLHPDDLSLAVYLRAMDIAAPDEAERIATSVRERPDLWWARAMATRILSGAVRRAATTQRTVQVREEGEPELVGWTESNTSQETYGGQVSDGRTGRWAIRAIGSVPTIPGAAPEQAVNGFRVRTGAAE